MTRGVGFEADEGSWRARRASGVGCVWCGAVGWGGVGWGDFGGMCAGGVGWVGLGPWGGVGWCLGFSGEELMGLGEGREGRGAGRGCALMGGRGGVSGWTVGR